jgi:hypothetical protein
MRESRAHEHDLCFVVVSFTKLLLIQVFTETVNNRGGWQNGVGFCVVVNLCVICIIVPSSESKLTEDLTKG